MVGRDPVEPMNFRRLRRTSLLQKLNLIQRKPMNSTEACIALNMLPTVGPVRLRRLLEIFVEPQRVLAAKRGELRAAEGIGNEVADQIANWESIVDLAAELDRIREFGAAVITQESPS